MCDRTNKHHLGILKTLQNEIQHKLNITPCEEKLFVPFMYTYNEMFMLHLLL